MTSGRKSKKARGTKSIVVDYKPRPWGTIIAVVAVLGLAGGVFGYAYSQISANNQREAALAQWKPSDTNKDPSDKIAGVTKKEYPAGKHVEPVKRVAYEASPPYGGAHDGTWADCTGVVYDKAVRTENMVHSMEHGALWIAYNPDQVNGPALDKLKPKAEGQQFTMLSPYPGLDKPIALQSWGHQLKLDSADDERIDQFISSLRRNPNTYPEPGATCEASPAQFDVTNPPPFVAEKPGPDAVPVDGGQEDPKEQNTAPSSTPAGGN
ncbi:Protein of unknown function [Lentzea albidocapillata subsp. violacea]|uniref:DUF3105 domain-containing protein n=2 Tax=Lentzea TaxID=165301 RepID=A0A1G9S4U0_9PSEU|nr:MULTISPECIES: DUF3105 domain-containing protein [Lentzea]MDX8143173.1 DUF3105 domain-containing protein [Lentzea sp. BCCO 10_0061]SDM30412.1 Protein of unknown function [Lentzea albidocapillata subsp. violacea]